MLTRTLTVVWCTSCLWLPGAGASVVSAWMSGPVVNAAAVTLTPAKLRLAPEAFAPATLTTDDVANNDSASANFIGTHHGVNYAFLGRQTGYYERAAYGSTGYLRYQASIFGTPTDAAAAMKNSVDYAATRFGGPNVCQGDDDDYVAATDTVIDDDNQYVSFLPGLNDQDPSCALPGFQVTSQIGGGATCQNDHDAGTLPMGAVDADAACAGVAAPGIPGDIASTVTCENDADPDDQSTLPGPTDQDLPCRAYAEVGGTINPASLVTPLDCSGTAQAPCALLGIGYSSPADDRMWYDVYGVFQTGRCMAEVDWVSRPQTSQALDLSHLMTAASQVVRKACSA